LLTIDEVGIDTLREPHSFAQITIGPSRFRPSQHLVNTDGCEVDHLDFPCCGKPRPEMAGAFLFGVCRRVRGCFSALWAAAYSATCLIGGIFAFIASGFRVELSAIRVVFWGAWSRGRVLSRAAEPLWDVVADASLGGA
jgi:hypothetical protein